ncbi:50S ribosomal protein L5 [Candidatus Vidania fulgoroideorum]
MNKLKEILIKNMNILSKRTNTKKMNIPKFKKIVLNCCLGILTENKIFFNNVYKSINCITNQKPLIIKAKKSISNFKIKKKSKISIKVTMRKDKMYCFIYKLIKKVFPNTRNFKKFSSKSFDENGNFNFGIKESSNFPELNKFNDIKNNFGMNITIVTNVNNLNNSLELFKLIKFPIE